MEEDVGFLATLPPPSPRLRRGSVADSGSLLRFSNPLYLAARLPSGPVDSTIRTSFKALDTTSPRAPPSQRTLQPHPAIVPGHPLTARNVSPLTCGDTAVSSTSRMRGKSLAPASQTWGNGPRQGNRLGCLRSTTEARGSRLFLGWSGPARRDVEGCGGMWRVPMGAS